MLGRFSALWICLKFAAPDSLGRKIDTDVICHDDGNVRREVKRLSFIVAFRVLIQNNP